MLRIFRRQRASTSSWASQTLPQGIRAQQIDGRRHLTEQPYALPKDLTEQDRLKFQHYALRATLKANYVVPLPDNIKFILDVGTGTGQWAYDMARQFQYASVVGLDLEPPAIPVWEIPRNYQFVQGDIRQGLSFPDNTFDFVHQRLLGVALLAREWPSVLRELVRVTRSGGYIQLLEVTDRFIQAGPATEQAMAWWDRAAEKAGFRLSLMWHLDILLEQAGAVDIHAQRVEVPLGAWDGRAGELFSKDLHSAFGAIKGFCRSHCSISEEMFDLTIAELPLEWERYHTSYCFYLVYGRKPGEKGEKHGGTQQPVAESTVTKKWALECDQVVTALRGILDEAR